MDGVTLDPSNLFANTNDNDRLSVNGTGMIYLYSSNPNIGTDSPNVKYFHDPSLFLNTCGVSVSYSTPGSETFTIPYLTPTFGYEMKLEVDYQQ